MEIEQLEDDTIITRITIDGDSFLVDITWRNLAAAIRSGLILRCYSVELEKHCMYPIMGKEFIIIEAYRGRA